jgi:DNA-binding CsgD family transcriptional regulator
MITVDIISILYFSLIILGAYALYKKIDGNAVKRELDRQKNEENKDSFKRLESKLDELNRSRGLTARQSEIDILSTLYEMDVNSIADKLFISPNTVANHKKNYSKHIKNINRIKEILSLINEDLNNESTSGS